MYGENLEMSDEAQNIFGYSDLQVGNRPIKIVIRPRSVNSLDGGFFTSQFCPVSWSASKNKNEFLLALSFSISLTVGVEWSEKKKRIILV